MKKTITIVLLLIIFSAPVVNVNASSSVIHNSVSVSSSDGVSTTHVKTVVNGKVIEDTVISTTTPYKYESTHRNIERHTDRDGAVDRYREPVFENTEASTKIIQLTALLNQLRSLIKQYEKLRDQ